MKILNYHSIASEPVRLPAGIDLDPDLFGAHLDHLKARHTVVSLETLLKTRDQSVAITFDDGYEDNYTQAFPRLRDRSLPAVIFVADGLVGKDWETPQGPRPALKVDQIQEMVESGWIEIGSHGKAHRNLTQLSDAELEDELLGSKARLEAITQRPCRFHSYPFGAFDERVLAATQAAGYEKAFSVWTPNQDEFSLVRIPIAREDSVLRLRMKLSPFYFPIKKLLRR